MTTSQSAPVRLRASLADIPAYKAGQRPAPRSDIQTFKISSNENPYAPLPQVVEAIVAAATQVHRYPDLRAGSLVDALARDCGVTPDRLVVGTGSVALCEDIVTIAAGPGDEVLYAWRAFESYPIVTHTVGATPVTVPLRSDETHDLTAMAAAVTDRTRVVFVCTPNNPTGTVALDHEVRALLQAIPDDVLVVIDEAYAEFVRHPDAVDGLQLAAEYDNVVSTRTMSKAYGLAGLRVGYAVGHPSVIEALGKVSTPFGVSGVAEAAALAALQPDVKAQALARVDALVAERDRMVAAVTAHGWRIADAQANFLWLRLGDRTGEVAAAFDSAGLTLRAFPGDGVRIGVAETAANDRSIEVLAGLVS